MSTAFPIDITGGYNPIRFPSVNNQTAINFFDFEGVLMPTPGHKKVLSVIESGRARGFRYSEILKGNITVIDDQVFLTTDNHKTKLFNIDTVIGNVSIAENNLTGEPSGDDPGAQIAIADGAFLYIYTLDGKVTKAHDDQSDDPIDFAPLYVYFKDTYFLIVNGISNRIYASEQNDGRVIPADSWDQIDAATQAVVALKTTVYVFGKDLVQPFHNAGLSPFPYAKDITQAFPYGLLSPWALAEGFGLMVWLGGNDKSDPVFLMSDGGEPTPISTPGIDDAIDKLTKPDDCECFIYQKAGHIFFQANFITDNLSLLYDFMSKKWWHVTDKNFDSHPIKQVSILKEKNKVLAISYESGDIYEFDINIYTDDGDIVPRVVISKTYSESPLRQIDINQVDLEIEQGENASKTEVFLDVSKDNGRSFHSGGEVTLASLGHRDALTRFRKLGTSRWWTFKLSCYSKDRVIVKGMTAVTSSPIKKIAQEAFA